MWWCGVVTFKHGLPLQPNHHKTLTFVEALQKPLIWELVGGWGHMHTYVPNLHRHGHHLVFVSCIFMDKGWHTRSHVFTGRHTETYRADTHKQTHTQQPSSWLQRPDVIMASCMLMLPAGTPLSAPQYSAQVTLTSFWIAKCQKWNDTLFLMPLPVCI